MKILFWKKKNNNNNIFEKFWKKKPWIFKIYSMSIKILKECIYVHCEKKNLRDNLLILKLLQY